MRGERWLLSIQSSEWGFQHCLTLEFQSHAGDVWAGWADSEVDWKMWEWLAQRVVTHGTGQWFNCCTPQGQWWVQHCSTALLMISWMGKSLSWVSLLRTQNQADTPENCAAIHRDLDWLEKWADRNLLMLNKGSAKHCAQGGTTLGINACWKTSWKAAWQKLS